MSSIHGGVISGSNIPFPLCGDKQEASYRESRDSLTCMFSYTLYTHVHVHVLDEWMNSDLHSSRHRGGLVAFFSPQGTVFTVFLQAQLMSAVKMQG